MERTRAKGTVLKLLRLFNSAYSLLSNQTSPLKASTKMERESLQPALKSSAYAISQTRVSLKTTTPLVISQ